MIKVRREVEHWKREYVYTKDEAKVPDHLACLARAQATDEGDVRIFEKLVILHHMREILMHNQFTPTDTPAIVLPVSRSSTNVA